MVRPIAFLLVASVLLALPANAEDAFDVPEGFLVEQVATDAECPSATNLWQPLAHTIGAARSAGSIEDQIYFLSVAARLTGQPSEQFTTTAAEALLHLQSTLEATGASLSRFWPDSIEQLTRSLCSKSLYLANQLVRRIQNKVHSTLTRALDGALRQTAIRKATELELVDNDWIALYSELPQAEASAILRPLGLVSEHRDAVALALAEIAQVEDRDFLLDSLGSHQSGVISSSTKALRNLPAPTDPEALVGLVRQLARRGTDKRTERPREQLLGLLNHWTDAQATDTAGALDWLKQAHPELAKTITPNPKGIDLATERDRWATIDWSKGDRDRGRLLFTQRACATCHEGSRRFGPDLKGIGKSWSPEDLLTATVAPSFQVSEAYRPDVMVLKNGDVHIGHPSYTSPAASLYRTGPQTVVRVTLDEVEEVRPSDISSMSDGLLLGVDDQGLADLVAYLRSPK